MRGHDQSSLSRLASIRNFAILRLRGAKSVIGIFHSPAYGCLPHTEKTKDLCLQLCVILKALETEVDIAWNKQKELLKDGK